MWSEIEQKSRSPVFEKYEDKPRIANLLNVVLLTILLIAVIRTILAGFASPAYLSFVVKQNIILVVVFAGVFVLMRQGQVRFAAFIFTLYQWLVVAFLTYGYGGVSLSVYSFFIFVILASGMLLGGRWAVAYAAISVAYGTLLLYLEHLGIVAARQSSAMEAYFVVTPSFITTAVIVYLYHRDITRALARAYGNATELTQTNALLSNAMADRQRMEEQLLQSQKMEAIGILAGGIAHDFNNILTIISGYGELAQMRLGDDHAAAVQDLDEILKGARRARDLVQQILTFSRRAEHEKRPLLLSSLIKEALKFLRSSIPSTIEIKQEIESQSLVLADPTQIHQIVMNLCTNASHAMRTHGGILLVALHDLALTGETTCGEARLVPGPYVRLVVSDTGCGMDEEAKRKIFEPYFTTKGKGEGTGLGMAVVFGIVQSHNGGITVASQVGRGTTIEVYLPVHQGDAWFPPSSQPEADPTLTGNHERIMFIDDEEAIAKFGQAVLSRFGYRVTTFTNANQAFRVFADHPQRFDLIVSDMTMPEMTGLDLARKIQEIRPETPMILCSGHSELVSRDQALALGISAYCDKPLSIAELAGTVRRALDSGKNEGP